MGKFKGKDGVEHRRKIVWIKLPDRPFFQHQQKIANLLWRSVGKEGWWYLEIEWGADFIPEDYFASGSLLRRTDDPLMPVAAISRREGVPPALVEIQDVFERTFHLNHGQKGIKYKNEREYTTAYWGTRDRLTRVKVYPGPKKTDKEERGFLRFELTKKSQALDQCLKAQRGGLYFPTLPNRPDIREFVKLLVPKDVDALAKAIHQKEIRKAGRNRFDKLKLRSIQRHLESDLQTKTHSEFREVVQEALGGGNLGYHFKQLYPVIPESLAR